MPPVIEPASEQEEESESEEQPPSPEESESESEEMTGFPSLEAMLVSTKEEFGDLVGQRAEYEKDVLGIDEADVAKADDFVPILEETPKKAESELSEPSQDSDSDNDDISKEEEPSAEEEP
jgi:hypothetical protein